MLLSIILFAGCRMQTTHEDPTQTMREEPIDPANPPPKISVTVKLVEYPTKDVSVKLTKVVFVWRGAASNPIYIFGDQRESVRVGQVIENCIIWDLYYRGDRSDYIYQLDYRPFDFPRLLYFSKNLIVPGDPKK
ncbi:MAG: hypothetical protein Q7S83_04140 [bacterium]|nr:hypothetical protein [bacterium]